MLTSALLCCSTTSISRPWCTSSSHSAYFFTLVLSKARLYHEWISKHSRPCVQLPFSSRLTLLPYHQCSFPHFSSSRSTIYRSKNLNQVCNDTLTPPLFTTDLTNSNIILKFHLYSVHKFFTSAPSFKHCALKLDSICDLKPMNCPVAVLFSFLTAFWEQCQGKLPTEKIIFSYFATPRLSFPAFNFPYLSPPYGLYIKPFPRNCHDL